MGVRGRVEPAGDEDKLKEMEDCKQESDPSFLGAALSGQTPDEGEVRRCRRKQKKVLCFFFLFCSDSLKTSQRS